jgi:hypothetical protein
MTATKVRKSGEITRPKKLRRLLSLFGALPATRPFSGKGAIREEVGRKLEGSAQ